MQPERRVIVGVDVGTTAARAVAFTLDGTARHVATRAYPVVEPVPGWRVQEPDVLVAATLAATSACVAGTAGAEVVALALSSARYGLIGLDAAMTPVTPLLTGRDTRSAEAARELLSSGQSRELHRSTGTPVHPRNPLCKLLWFARHEPYLCTATRWWVGLKDYVVHRLTGMLVTELSSASGTGMFDVHRRAWSSAVLDLAGVSESQLPPVLPTTAVLRLSPAAGRAVGLPPGTPVVVGAGDGPLRSLGAAATEHTVGGLTLGATGALRTVVRAPRTDAAETFSCAALTEDAWVVRGSVGNGGNVVRWAARVLGDDNATPALLDLAARIAPGSDGVVMLPYLWADPAAPEGCAPPGAFLGLRGEHSRAHLVRAAVEGVCLQLGGVRDRLAELTPIGSVRLTGGAFRSPLWREVMAAVLDCPVQVAGAADQVTLGAAALGLFAIGHTADLQAAVTQLDPGAGGDRVTVDPALATAYRGLRTRLPTLVTVAGRLGEILDAGTGLSAPARP
ncbi:gluconokinase [Micromonospora sp. M51]|uniref:Gluconokinase n=1 Tax=Micromonospora parva TaxID=1464048 RepID=A0ABW6VNK5_9ACTN|nr:MULTISPECIES: gluconokinase [Micromonospora]MBQ1011696.1 gluconokinase [Micromonospora sp. M51]MBQ1033304.1 gluconokinase [Micromonospora sp. C97]